MTAKMATLSRDYTVTALELAEKKLRHAAHWFHTSKSEEAKAALYLSAIEFAAAVALVKS